jgi:2-amino-4-hydroxy-6-hydroxymethyldihydropteridine diphosphokinase
VIGYLGLGSNVGDRRAYLQAAAAALAQDPDIVVLASSSIYETEPQGEVRDQPLFLNAAVRIETTLDPHALLQAAKDAEQTVGRTPTERHGPREVDVDLLLLGDTELETDRLTLPHPETTSRRFVLVPLLELDPELRIPGRGSASDALAALHGQAVRLAGPPLVV